MRQISTTDTMRNIHFLPFVFCCFFAVFSLQVYAQSTDASVTGTIRSLDNETLPGATVIIHDESTGFETGTITNVNGKYDIKQ